VKTLPIISRALALVEAVALALIALVIWAVLIFGIGALVSSFSNLLIGIVFMSISLGCAAAVSALFDYARAADATVSPYGLREVLVAVGAIGATLLAVIAASLLSPQEQWTRGIDFARLGVLLWIPITHMAIVRWARRPLTCVGADTRRGSVEGKGAADELR
jgi:hypothetical protein